MKNKRLLIFLSILLVASFILTACQSATQEPQQDETEVSLIQNPLRVIRVS